MTFFPFSRPHLYPLIVRAGGLVDALGPEVARRQVDPESGNLTLECASFNDRNLYFRQTPCDQDFLRKLARDTEPEPLEEWYNRHVVTVYKGCDRAGARDYAAFLGFFSLEPS